MLQRNIFYLAKPDCQDARNEDVKTMWVSQLTWSMVGTLHGELFFTTLIYHTTQYLSGYDPKAAQEEKVRHDKALEAYQAANAKYQKDHTKLLDWIATNDRMKDQAKQNFTNTDYTFKLYNQAHPDK